MMLYGIVLNAVRRYRPRQLRCMNEPENYQEWTEIGIFIIFKKLVDKQLNRSPDFSQYYIIAGAQRKCKDYGILASIEAWA